MRKRGKGVDIGAVPAVTVEVNMVAAVWDAGALAKLRCRILCVFVLIFMSLLELF